MDLVMAGLHQRTAPIALRERLAFSEHELPGALAALRRAVDEGFIISTCNRVEVYGVAESAEALRSFLAARHGAAELEPHLTIRRGPEVARHLCRLAAGLDSMVLGEDQIVGQIKAALEAAEDAGAIGQGLRRLIHSALAAGKAVRTQTGIAQSHLSVVSVALDLARTALGGLEGRRVLVVGAGRMAELALKHLHKSPARAVAVANRTLARATALAERYGATALPLEALGEALGESDVAICCTAAAGLVLDSPTVARAAAGRATPLLLLDLAVPRDVDPAAGALPGVRLCDVDDLQTICAANREARAAEIERAEEIVDEAVAKFSEWWDARRVAPTIRALRERAEAIRAAEVRRALARLPGLSERDQATVEALTAAIVNKLLHPPIAALKDEPRDLDGAARRLFQIETA